MHRSQKPLSQDALYALCFTSALPLTLAGGAVFYALSANPGVLVICALFTLAALAVALRGYYRVARHGWREDGGWGAGGSPDSEDPSPPGPAVDWERFEAQLAEHLRSQTNAPTAVN